MGDTRRVISHVLFDLYGTLGLPPAEVIERFRDEFRLRGFSVEQAARIDLALSQNESDGMLHTEPSQSPERYREWVLKNVTSAVAEFRDLSSARIIAEELLTFYEHLEYEMRPVPDAQETIDALRRDDVVISVCSNWSWGLDNALRSMGLRDMVDHVFSSAWLGARKPHPDYFLHTLHKLDALPESCVFVGDTWEADILGSAAVGMHPVFIRTHRKLKGAPSSMPVHEIDALLETVDYVRNLRSTNS